MMLPCHHIIAHTTAIFAAATCSQDQAILGNGAAVKAVKLALVIQALREPVAQQNNLLELPAQRQQ